MKYNKMPDGTKVSEIGFGCEGFGELDPEESMHLIRTGYDAGINMIDLFSPKEKIRRNIGDSLERLKIRERFVIQGQLGTTVVNGHYKRTRDIEIVRESFENLLECLHTDYLDIGMIHYVDDEKDFESVFHGEFIAYVLEQKKKGVIHLVGASSHNPVIAKKMIATGLLDVLLFSINPCFDMAPPSEDLQNLFHQDYYKGIDYHIHPEREELYRLCEDKGIAITVMKCFAGGNLLDEHLSVFHKAMTPVQCISYALHMPGTVSVMIGVKSEAELKEALAYEKCPASEKDFSSFLAELEGDDMEGVCVYCGHCSPCVKGIDIASVNKYTALGKGQKNIPDSIKDHYFLLQKHASDCIGCRSCEKNCPFHVHIREKMKEAEILFGY